MCYYVRNWAAGAFSRAYLETETTVMEANNIKLSQFINAGPRVFYIPVYQRNYDWRKEQCVRLFKDIEKIANASDKSVHFLGSIVYVDVDSTPDCSRFTIIDGQQRLTSVMLFLKALSDSTDNERLKTEIYESYLINKFADDDSLRIKLKPMKSDAANFYKLLNNQIQEMGETQILLNYKLFLSLVSESRLTVQALYRGFQKLEIVYIRLTEENPQLIFESLNSTGMDLTQADLIRNFLLMGQEHSLQERLYNNYWIKLEKLLPSSSMLSDFIRDYLTLKTRTIPNKSNVYDAFKSYYLEAPDNCNVERFLTTLADYGRYYSWFKFCNSPNGEVNDRLSQIQRLKSTTVYPFLLGVFDDCFSRQGINEDMLCKTLDVLLSYFVRRLLCEMPTNALNKVFATMASDSDIHHCDSISLCERVAIALSRKQGKVIFPDDDLLKEKLLTRNFSKVPYIKYILEKIECNKGKEIVKFDDLSLEHIMPQTLSPQWRIDLGKKAKEIHDKYLDCLGNLTLTGYNSELSNARFEDKKVWYKGSNLYMNKEIGVYQQWGEDEILARCKALSKDICAVWVCPDAVSSKKYNADTRTEFDITDEVNVTGRTPCLLEICGDVIPVDSWRNFILRLCKKMYEYDAEIFRSLLTHRDFAGRSKRVISDSDAGMIAARKIAEGVYLETNLSANDALNYAKLVIGKYEGMDEECSYKLKPVQ